MRQFQWSILIAVSAALLLAAGPLWAQTRPDAGLPGDDEIRQVLLQRIDTMKQGVGIVVGIIEPAGQRVIAYGQLNQDDAHPLNGDTVFEIGSATKVFTSLLLADMAQKGEVALDDPVSKYLPPGVKMPQRGGKSITLVDLSTHTSGLPRLPDNLFILNPNNPYAFYPVPLLYDFLSHYQLQRDIGSEYEYSNLGGGLLGHVLSLRAGMEYEQLVRSRICKPLGMDSTVIKLTPELKARFAAGHGPDLTPRANWDFLSLPGAGALRSTVNDMLKFLDANLNEGKSPLGDAPAFMLKTRRPTGTPDQEIALGWMVEKKFGDEIIWHNGGTGGYRSFMGFRPKTKIGVVVLSNTFTDAGVDDIGRHLLDSRFPTIKPAAEHREIAIDQKLLDTYVGKYPLAPNFVLTITHEGDRLFAQATGQPKYQIFPEGPRAFFYKVVDAQITFEVDKTGRATKLVLHQNGNDLPGLRTE
jgi:CubicO group peptidase (beta-lactamase class C family)